MQGKAAQRRRGMDIRLFDNYEEDGQLSLFGFDEMEEEMPDGAACLFG